MTTDNKALAERLTDYIEGVCAPATLHVSDVIEIAELLREAAAALTATPQVDEGRGETDWQVEFRNESERSQMLDDLCTANARSLFRALHPGESDDEIEYEQSHDVTMEAVARIKTATPSAQAGAGSWVDLHRGQFGSYWQTNDPSGIMPEGRYYYGEPQVASLWVQFTDDGEHIRFWTNDPERALAESFCHARPLTAFYTTPRPQGDASGQVSGGGEMETQARAMFEAQADKQAAPWDQQWEPTKQHWRGKAIAALSPTQPQEQAPTVDGGAVNWRIDITDGGSSVWCDNESTARAQAFDLRKRGYACTIVPLFAHPAPKAEVARLVEEYRPTMDNETLYSWARDIVRAFTVAQNERK